MSEQHQWTRVGVGSRLRQRIITPVPATYLGKLEDLPINELGWSLFERLQWVMLADVEGLRNAHEYGERGQEQFGVDVIALRADGTGTALQSKDYKVFHPGDLKAAVDKFRTTTRPFDVDRLIIGVSSDVRSTSVLNMLTDLRGELDPIDLVLWDKKEISRKLRDHPLIVIEFFGEETARRFCNSFTAATIAVPSMDAVAVRNAVARTPEVSTGAKELLDQADDEDEPVVALELVDRARALLREAGYLAHASALEGKRSMLLLQVGRGEEAARDLLEDVWQACALGRTSIAQSMHRQLIATAQGGPNSGAASERVRGMVLASESAMRLNTDPLGSLPDPASWSDLEAPDRIRLMVTAGETSLATGDSAWLASAADLLDECLTLPCTPFRDAETWQIRLRLLLAETHTDWSDVLDRSRRKKLPDQLSALVTARYARHLAINQNFLAAEEHWEEAVGEACLAQRWTAAATWIFSQRVFRGRWKPFTSDALLPIQLALIDMGPSPDIIPADSDALSNARAALLDDKHRRAAIAAQRALRDAVSIGDWAGEMDACRLLGSILTPDEPELAAAYFARAGSIEGMKSLAQEHPHRFIDVTADLEAPNYWTVAATYRLLAEQADLLPDPLVDGISNQLVGDLNAADAGTLIDLRPFTTSRYLSAIKALAALASRLSPSTAEVVLQHFEAQPAIGSGQYRYHDDDEATVIAGVARAHPKLRERALRHLVPLLVRSETARRRGTDVLDDYFKEVTPLLQAIDSDWANELLVVHGAALVDQREATEALDRICAPIAHTPGMFTVGNSALRDSLLVGGLSEDQHERAIATLLEKADDEWASWMDRSSYLLAGANLADKLSTARREAHFDGAMACATSPSDSLADQTEAAFSHPLGAVRIDPAKDTRPQATYLAARLAVTDSHRDAVRDVAFALLGEPDVGEVWVTRALICIKDDLATDTSFLSGRGPALRDLAAQLWGPQGEPAPVGLRLARDEVMTVRRTLAANLGQGTVAQSTVLSVLEQDPSFEVRSALSGQRPAADDTHRANN